MFKRLIFLALLLFTTTTLVKTDFHDKALAQTQCVENSSASVEDRIKACEQEIAGADSKVQSLGKEIAYLDAQINLTKLRIQQSNAEIVRRNAQITKLEEDIGDLGDRIGKLSGTIDLQNEILGKRSRARYESIETSPLYVIFGSGSLSGIVQKLEYLRTMSVEDKKLLDQMRETRGVYDKQKGLLGDKKEQIEALKKQIEAERRNLEVYSNQLDTKKVEKQRLIEMTKNDEANFQKLLEEAKREQNQIVGAVSVLKNQKSAKVKKGDVIGNQGNTGYSFGEHLHFGVYKYSSFEDIDGWSWYYSNYVDPATILKSKSISWRTGCESPGSRKVGKGDGIWPLSNPTVSQGFGYTCWSRVYYGGKPHPAFDMYSSANSPVYAVEEGNAYSCRNCLGDGGNGVFIFHPNGYMTLYWHLR